MKAMILAAGFGKRLLPITENIPKPLLKVGNFTLIQRNIQLLIENGFSEIIINVSYLGDQIKEHIDEIFPKENISFSFEKKPLGTGGGVLKALPLLGNKSFMLINADIFHKIDLNNLPQDVEAAHLVGVPNPEHNLDGDFNLVKDIIEINSDSNTLTWSGISVINPEIFMENSFKNDSFNIWNTVLPKYISRSVVTGQISSEPWLDVGTPERLKLANTVYNDQD
tara:strand:- start:3000 stop:3671 length:672 start_codon:yes stop_codon:yes gene_type:complete